MFKKKPFLPDVPIYGFIGGIPDTFGGRTGACLQRANAFAELDGREMEILTLSPAHGTDPEALTSRLRLQGWIGDRVSIRNIWSDLRRASDTDLNRICEFSSSTASTDLDDLLPYAGELDEIRKDTSGKTVQVDRFRYDGTRVTSYRVNGSSSDSPKGRTVTLFNHNGEAVGQWAEQHFMYFAWMDWIIGSRPTVLINDGPPLARYLYQYRRDNLIFVQTIHSRHSSNPKSTSGVLAAAYLPTLEHIDSFDRVAVLTDAQHKDIMDLHLGGDNLIQVPNMAIIERVRKVEDRDPGAGVVLAKTTRQKRIDHAISAVGTARAIGVDARLDIYGAADDADESLRNMLVDHQMEDFVRMHGFDSRAKRKFETSSFTLLTSRYEGQPLVLLESMASGCIPIAYDIEYGPADIITHGKNGFLVPDGDVSAMAKCIKTLATMDNRDVMKMRRSAVKRTLDYTPERITRLWGQALGEALSQKQPIAELEGRATLLFATMDTETIRLKLSISVDSAPEPKWAMLAWTRRQGDSYGRVPANLHTAKGGSVVEAAINLESFSSVDAGNIDFWIDLRISGSAIRLRVKDVKRGLHFQEGRFELYPTKHKSLSLIIR